MKEAWYKNPALPFNQVTKWLKAFAFMARKRSAMSNLITPVSIVPSVVHVQRYGDYVKVGAPETNGMYWVRVVGNALVEWLSRLARGHNDNFAALPVETGASVRFHVLEAAVFVEYSQLAIVPLEVVFALMAQQKPGEPGVLAIERPNCKPQWNVFRTQVASEVCGLWVWKGVFGWSVYADFLGQGKQWSPGDRMFGVVE